MGAIGDGVGADRLQRSGRAGGILADILGSRSTSRSASPRYVVVTPTALAARSRSSAYRKRSDEDRLRLDPVVDDPMRRRAASRVGVDPLRGDLEEYGLMADPRDPEGMSSA